jgi:hypothetical protein
MPESLVSLYRQRWNTFVLATGLSVVLLSFPFLFDEHLSFHEGWYWNFLLFSLYFVPAMTLYGFPVHLLAVFATHRLRSFLRIPASLAIHLGFAGVLAAFSTTLAWFALPCAFLFFLTGEACDWLERRRGKKFPNRFILWVASAPFLIWAGWLAWHAFSPFLEAVRLK